MEKSTTEKDPMCERDKRDLFRISRKFRVEFTTEIQTLLKDLRGSCRTPERDLEDATHDSVIRLTQP